MPRASSGQLGFNSGLLSPLLDSRNDVDAYNRGCRELKNWLPTPQGPAKKRLGTRYVGEVKDSSKKVRLVEFIFSDIDSYILEFGDQYIRFHQGRDRVLETGINITGATNANPVVITAASHGFSNGDHVIISGVGGMTNINSKEFYTVANKTTDTFELSGVDGTSFGAYTSGGTVSRIYEISSPYTESDLYNIKYAQVGDIMYLTAGGTSIRPQKISRLGNANWTIAAIDNQKGPVLDVNTTSTTMDVTSGTMGVGNTVTITASAGTFQSGHVGSVWRFADNSTNNNPGYARMTAYSSATQADFEVQSTFTTSATDKWNEGAWSGVRGYPRAIAFHESRLAFAGTNEDPLTVDLSQPNDRFESFVADEALDDDGLRITIGGRKNTIQWMVSDGDFLVCGTFGGLAFLGSGSGAEALTPTNIKANNGVSFGSANIQGIELNNSIKYAQRSGTSVYEAQYDDISLNYVSRDLTVLNDEILPNAALEFAVQEEPFAVLWAVRDDGTLVGLTQETQQQVNGWHTHTTGSTDKFESVAVIPGAKFDEVWFVVNRTVDGNTRRHIEYKEPDEDKYHHVDSAVYYNGSATKTVNGLDHLEGEQVDVLGDGAYGGRYTVSSGSITILSSASEIYAGLPYSADLKPMLLEGGSANGPSHGKKKRIHKLYVKLYKTLGLKVGRDFNNLKTVPFRNVGDSMDSAPPLFGSSRPEFKEIDFNGTWDSEAEIAIRHDTPTPCTLISIHPQFKTNDG